MEMRHLGRDVSRKRGGLLTEPSGHNPLSTSSALPERSLVHVLTVSSCDTRDSVIPHPTRSAADGRFADSDSHQANQRQRCPYKAPELSSLRCLRIRTMKRPQRGFRRQSARNADEAKESPTSEVLHGSSWRSVGWSTFRLSQGGQHFGERIHTRRKRTTPFMGSLSCCPVSGQNCGTTSPGSATILAKQQTTG